MRERCGHYCGFREIRENRDFTMIEEVLRYPSLKWLLLICKRLILESRVEGGIRSLAAAPSGPEIRPLHSASAASMICRSRVKSSSGDRDSGSRAGTRLALLDSHASSTQNTSSELTMTDLSTTFCNSRIFPGQS